MITAMHSPSLLQMQNNIPYYSLNFLLLRRIFIFITVTPISSWIVKTAKAGVELYHYILP